MYIWSKNNKFGNKKSQMDLLVVSEIFNEYETFEVPIIEDCEFDIKTINSFDEYKNLLEFGNTDGFSV